MRAIGIILAGGNSSRMRELSNKRAIAAMPVAGSYRGIDFVLSNMSNSHIQKVAVLTQYNSRSLNEHLSSSKWWDFGRKQGGLYVFNPTITADNGFWYRGTADAIAQNLTFLRNSHEPYVVIASGDGVYKLDYNKLLEYHIEKKADITIVTKAMDSDEDCTRFGVVQTDEDGRITRFQEKPLVVASNLISTGVYVIRRRQLIEMIEKAMEEDRTDFVKDVLVRYIDDGLLEQYCECGILLQNKYGFPQEGYPRLFLQAVSGYIFQDRRSPASKVQSGRGCEKQPCFKRLYYQRCSGKFCAV